MIEFNFGENLSAQTTPIAGLLLFHLPVHGDNRGWFKENWQREKMVGLGLPDFAPIQNNMSFNAAAGVTRGLHAEPWDKFISVATGAVFGAWCDLREGSETFGQTFTTRISPDTAVFVPRGVANGFQALVDETVYTYLVNDHWSPAAEYTNVNLADPALSIPWPISLDQAELSEKDKDHRLLADIVPVPPRKILITGAEGQLGRALRHEFPQAEFVSHNELDITDPNLVHARTWRQYQTIINAAAYTNVDAAEDEGRGLAWAVNATAVSNLAGVARDNALTLVHISTDYVFDGESSIPYTENAGLTPLGVYGASKAAGDVAAAMASQHYIVRTSWVVGDGSNFVSTMAELATGGIEPRVVDDQTGRLTFAHDIAAGIAHLLQRGAPYGTYNLTGSGEPATWFHIAQLVYEHLDASPDSVTPVSTAEYFSDRRAAPRPANSVLDLSRIQATGFTPRDWRDGLADYLKGLGTR